MKNKSVSRRRFIQASGVAIGAATIPSAPEESLAATAKALAADPPEATRILAEWIADSTWQDVPGQARREAVRSVFNWVGCCLGGARHDTTDRALAALAGLSGRPEATVLGRPDRLDILHGAFMNGLSSHVLDYDDTHLDTIIHPAGPVASAILALGERRATAGREFMHAFVLGVEAECRIGLAVYPSHYERGFHITGTAGVFGAAAAAGKLLGLDARQMAWALGIAATQSAGLKEMFGTMCKAFHVGSAAQNGLRAALLAAQGFTSTDRAIEAPEGFAFAFSDEQDFSRITDGLGETWEIEKNTYKPFSCGIVTHPIIDGCITLRNEHALSAGQIDRISLRVNPLVLKLTGKRSPRTGLEAKFSIYYISAAAIVDGMAGPNQFTDEALRNPEVTALQSRVEAVIDENVGEEAAFVTIVLKDGRVLEQHVLHAIGSVERPLSAEQLERKFADQARTALPPAQIADVMALCRDIERQDDVGDIARAAAAR